MLIPLFNKIILKFFLVSENALAYRVFYLHKLLTNTRELRLEFYTPGLFFILSLWCCQPWWNLVNSVDLNKSF